MSHLRVVHSASAPERRRLSRSSGANTVRVEAPGKVNLFLACGAPGKDGYHELNTVFQAVRLIETVTARRQSLDAQGTFTLAFTGAEVDLPTDARNLAVRAAKLLAAHTGVTQGVDLLVRKRVPVAGGMAGGSADAAATLVACNQLWGTGLSLEELCKLAAQLGADCAFPLLGASALGAGRGDQLSALLTRGVYHWVFAVSRQGLATPEVFARFDQLHPQLGEPAPVPPGLTAALRAGDASALAACLHNDLQEAALDLRPQLAQIIALAHDAGALRAIVSGSGPTIAALVPDAATAMRVSRALSTVADVCATHCVDAPVAGARVVG